MDDMPPELGDSGGESENVSSAESARELTKEQAELYGEELDAQDEAWVAKQRSGRKSDAHLSCPSCLCTLTIDCQRHASEEQQWRAMFVTNCRVDTSQVEPVKALTRGKRRRGRQTAHHDPSQVFHPVFCEVCGVKVGVHDSEQVYHFLHVLASLA